MSPLRQLLEQRLGLLEIGSVKAFGEPRVDLSQQVARLLPFPLLVREIADQRYYADLPGGVLEAAGRLFKRSVKLYVYPTRDVASGAIQTVEHAPIPPPWHHLRDLLLDVGGIEPIRHYDERFLAIRTPDVRARIEVGDDSWMAMVPAVVADTIKSEQLFGYGAARAAS